MAASMFPPCFASLGTLAALVLIVLVTPALAADTKTTTTTAPTTTRGPRQGPRGPVPGSVTCATVEQAGSASALPVESLRALQPQQASSCIALLGKDPLAEDQARAIWDLLLQAYETAEMVPDETVRLLGWVSGGIPPDHMGNLSLSEVDTVSSLGAFHNLSLEQLTALAESVRFQWSAKEPEDLSHLDLAALNHILCGFNASDVARVHADAYKEAASSLSLLRCPGTPGAVPVPGAWPGAGNVPDTASPTGPGPGLPALHALASLAESFDAFGDPGGWTTGTVRAVGCVLVGLSNASLARVPTASLHAMLQALAGSDQPVIRRCLYGTPIIAQRLSSSDQPQQQQASSITTSTIGPNVSVNVSATGGTRGNASASNASNALGNANTTTTTSGAARGSTTAKSGGSTTSTSSTMASGGPLNATSGGRNETQRGRSQAPARLEASGKLRRHARFPLSGAYSMLIRWF